MPQWLDQRIDNWLQGQGYVKAAQVRSAPIGAVWEGEAPEFNVDSPALSNEVQARTERLALTSAWAYSDINLIAKEFSGAAFHVYERSGPESAAEVPDHPFELLLQRPNAFMGRAFLWQYSALWQELRGEAYWMLVPDRAGQLVELWPLPASRVEPVPDAHEFIKGFRYTYRHGANSTVIDPRYILFVRFPNPLDYHRGLSPLSAARLGLETDYGAAQWNQTTYQNDVVLRTLISIDRNTSTPDFERIRSEIVRELVENRKRFLIARAGDVDAKALGLSHKDLEFLEGRGFTREEIDRVFGVPPGIWAKDATQANSEAARATLIGSTVRPLHVLWQEDLTSQVLQRWYGEQYTGQFEDIRPRDRALLAEERKVYWQVKRLEEARADLGLDPLGDERDQLLVPELLGQSRGGGLGLFGSDAAATPGAGEAKTLDQVALKADLRRWQSVALRRLRDGEGPGGYDFASDYIPRALAATIKTALAGAETAEEVKAAFAAPFHHQASWVGYP
ncbi:MAG: phage portal protein [Chloroflexi bacterium]|nr:phage portal protein [Chloroflexota bacterium]